METGCRGKNPSNRRKSRLCGAELSNRKSQSRCCSYWPIRLYEIVIIFTIKSNGSTLFNFSLFVLTPFSLSLSAALLQPHEFLDLHASARIELRFSEWFSPLLLVCPSKFYLNRNPLRQLIFRSVLLPCKLLWLWSCDNLWETLWNSDGSEENFQLRKYLLFQQRSTSYALSQNYLRRPFWIAAQSQDLFYLQSRFEKYSLSLTVQWSSGFPNAATRNQVSLLHVW